MPTLQCFLTEAESIKMLIDFCASRRSKIIVMTRAQISECRNLIDLSNTLSHLTRHLLVIGSKLVISDELRLRSPRDEGWLEVTIGRETEDKGRRILTMSSFASKHTGVGGKFHRWFRTYTYSANFKKGVNARNEINGVERLVPDVCYSEQALELFCLGGEWRQFVDGKIVFTPSTYSDSAKRESI